MASDSAVNLIYTSVNQNAGPLVCKLRQILMEAPIQILGETDIRRPLKKWLAEIYSAEANTVVVEELKIPRPSARVDVAVLNGKLCGFEIKSDRDSLIRLRDQQHAYSAVFEQMFLVTTPRHAPLAMKTIPSWWGIVMPTVTERGLHFVVKRRAGANPALKVRSLLHLLDRADLLLIASSIPTLKLRSSLRKDDLVEAIAKRATTKTIKSAVLLRLKERAVRAQSWSVGASERLSLRRAISRLIEFLSSRLWRPA